jgi:hypothetical protein
MSDLIARRGRRRAAAGLATVTALASATAVAALGADPAYG